MRFLLRVLSLLLIIYLLRYLFRSIFPSPSARSSSTPAGTNPAVPSVRQGRMEKDPVCGIYVDVATAPQLTRAGESKYFCSPECLEKYKKRD
jgi:YHS domain-containing protein